MGYSDERIRQLCQEYLAQGFDAFKLKVGRDLESDKKRCALVREEIGWDNKLVSLSGLGESNTDRYNFLSPQMVDANQIWDVNEAIDWMKQLTDYKLLWIEEPTSPDDILGHAKIADALRYEFYSRQRAGASNS